MRFRSRHDGLGSDRTRAAFIATTDISIQSHQDGLAGYLEANGIDVTLIAADTGRLAEVAARNGCEFVAVPMERDPRIAHDLLSALRLIVAMFKTKPDVVIYGTPKAALLGAIASRVARVPRRVLVIHGLRVETLSGVARRIHLFLDRVAEALSSEVIAVGRGVGHRAVELGSLKVPPKVLAHGSAQGVDLTRFVGVAPPAVSGTRHIGFVGRVTADKGVDSLVEAFQAVRAKGHNAQLHLVGACEGWQTLSEATQASIISDADIVLHGDVEDVTGLMATFDILCLPTRREGLPTVLIEAAAMGVPIVASTATGVRDVVSEDTASLVAIDDAPELVRAFEEVLVDAEGARARAAVAASAARTRFANEVVWSAWRDFLEPNTPARAGEGPVLWLTKGLAQGGAETLMLALAETGGFLPRKIHVAFALSSHRDMVEDFEAAGVKVHDLGGRRTLDVRWIWRLARLTHVGGFEVVHAHSPLLASMARVFTRAKGAGRRPRMVTTEHNMRTHYHPATRFLNDLTAPLDDTRFAVSRAAQESWRGTRGGDVETLVHWPPIDKRALSRRDARQALGVGDTVPLVMTIANLRPEKRLDLLLRSMVRIRARVDSVQLLIVGDGTMMSELSRLAETLDLNEAVTFTGRIRDARTLLRAADVAVLSSDVEGLPVFLMESMSLGIPFVSTGVGGVPEVVKQRTTGLLVQPGDEVGLAEAIVEVLEDRCLRRRLTENARRFASARSLDVAARRMNDAYGGG